MVAACYWFDPGFVSSTIFHIINRKIIGEAIGRNIWWTKMAGGSLQCYWLNCWICKKIVTKPTDFTTCAKIAIDENHLKAIHLIWNAPHCINKARDILLGQMVGRGEYTTQSCAGVVLNAEEKYYNEFDDWNVGYFLKLNHTQKETIFLCFSALLIKKVLHL